MTRLIYVVIDSKGNEIIAALSEDGAIACMARFYHAAGFNKVKSSYENYVRINDDMAVTKEEFLKQEA